MVALAESEELDDILKRLFDSEHVVKLGFSYVDDLKSFRKRLPNMKFYRNMTNFLDI